jgi:hypothetical protein
MTFPPACFISPMRLSLLGFKPSSLPADFQSFRIRHSAFAIPHSPFRIPHFRRIPQSAIRMSRILTYRHRPWWSRHHANAVKRSARTMGSVRRNRLTSSASKGYSKRRRNANQYPTTTRSACTRIMIGCRYRSTTSSQSRESPMPAYRTVGACAAASRGWPPRTVRRRPADTPDRPPGTKKQKAARSA